jgi:hypothetical protein
VFDPPANPKVNAKVRVPEQYRQNVFCPDSEPKLVFLGERSLFDVGCQEEPGSNYSIQGTYTSARYPSDAVATEKACMTDKASCAGFCVGRKMPSI